jgi:hypothetical protein
LKEQLPRKWDHSLHSIKKTYSRKFVARAIDPAGPPSHARQKKIDDDDRAAITHGHGDASPQGEQP